MGQDQHKEEETSVKPEARRARLEAQPLEPLPCQSGVELLQGPGTRAESHHAASSCVGLSH